MTPDVISADAEEASALVFETLAAHRTAIASLRSQPPPRLAVRSTSDAKQVQCQATLVRILSITESFASTLLLGEIDKVVARAANAGVDKLWEDAGVRGTSSWKEQQQSYRDWLGVREDWKAVERLAEARNSVAHGLGKLTRRQLRNEASVRDKLSKAGVVVDGDKVIFSDATLASAATECRDLIHRLDLAVQSRPETYR